MARKTVQKIPCQEDLCDGDLGSYSWTQGPFWELRSRVTLFSFSRNFGSFAGGCTVPFACCFTNFLLAKYTLPGSTPVCGKERFFFKKSVPKVRSCCSFPGISQPGASVVHWSGVILMASKHLLELRELHTQGETWNSRMPLFWQSLKEEPARIQAQPLKGALQTALRIRERRMDMTIIHHHPQLNYPV